MTFIKKPFHQLTVEQKYNKIVTFCCARGHLPIYNEEKAEQNVMRMFVTNKKLAQEIFEFVPPEICS